MTDVVDFSLLGFVGVVFLAALSGAVYKPGDWYESLDRPDWRPPNWAFPIVWTILYAMIAASGWMVWRANGGFAGAETAFVVYGVQLCLNAAWSYFFFGRRRIDLALVEAGLLWLSIAATIAAFAPISTTAALLLAPYLVWVTVAFALNLSIFRRNPGVRG